MPDRRCASAGAELAQPPQSDARVVQRDRPVLLGARKVCRRHVREQRQRRPSRPRRARSCRPVRAPRWCRSCAPRSRSVDGGRRPRDPERPRMRDATRNRVVLLRSNASNAADSASPEVVESCSAGTSANMSMSGRRSTETILAPALATTRRPTRGQSWAATACLTAYSPAPCGVPVGRPQVQLRDEIRHLQPQLVPQQVGQKAVVAEPGVAEPSRDHERVLAGQPLQGPMPVRPAGQRVGQLTAHPVRDARQQQEPPHVRRAGRPGSPGPGIRRPSARCPRTPRAPPSVPRSRRNIAASPRPAAQPSVRSSRISISVGVSDMSWPASSSAASSG